MFFFTQQKRGAFTLAGAGVKWQKLSCSKARLDLSGTHLFVKATGQDQNCDSELTSKQTNESTASVGTFVLQKCSQYTPTRMQLDNGEKQSGCSAAGVWCFSCL